MLEVKFDNSPATWKILAKDGLYDSKSYKSWIKKQQKLRFTGIVELREVAARPYNQNTKAAVLVVSKINPL